ncbi:hypothetical protein A9Q81_05920 [Gammaproteobacteria bacterium 42_54_T18]|nr:hypothetical protein A9Q81_05920 [Gammaproteobacteria bacterium 42_54_T18]
MAWNTKSFELLSRHVSAYLGGVKEKSCSFQGMEWKYLDAGSGEVVLCLHGLGSSKVQWRAFMASLAKHYRVVSPDVPVFSLRLDIPETEHTKRNIANWITAFMGAIGEREFHIVGHGSGGGAASYLAHALSDSVKTLAWFNPPDMEAVRKGENVAWERVKAGFDTVEQAEAHLNSLFYDPPQFPEIVKRFYMKKIMDAVNRGEIVPLIDKAVDSLPLLMAQLRELRQETLLVDADHDVLSSRAWVCELDALIPNCTLVTIERCGQRSLTEKPDQLAEIYLNFLKTRGS